MNITNMTFGTTGNESLERRVATMGRPGSKLISIYNGYTTKQYREIGEEQNMDILTFEKNGEWVGEAKLVW